MTELFIKILSSSSIPRSSCLVEITQMCLCCASMMVKALKNFEHKKLQSSSSCERDRIVKET